MKVYLTLMLMLGSLVAFSQDYPGAGYVAKVKNVKFKSVDQKTGRYIAILTDNSVLDIKYNDVSDTEIAAMYSFISIPSGFDGFWFKGDQNFIFLNSRLPFLFTVMGFKPGEIKEIKAAVLKAKDSFKKNDITVALNFGELFNEALLRFTNNGNSIDISFYFTRTL